MKESFILYADMYAPIQGLSLEQKGTLLDAMFRFNMGEDVSFSDPVVGMAFAFFRISLERNKQKYQEVVEKRKESGRKGGLAKLANAAFAKQKYQDQANLADHDHDPDPDPDPEEEEKEDAIASMSPAEPDDTPSAGGVDQGKAESSPLTGEQPKTEQQPKRKSEHPPSCPHELLREIYHELLPELPRAVTWGEERQKLLRARWRETWERLRKAGKPHGEDALLAWWRAYFARVRASPFLMGRVLDRSGKAFFADFEWLVRPTNYAKVIDGKYLDRRQAA